jgi:hypothetical protein
MDTIRLRHFCYGGVCAFFGCLSPDFWANVSSQKAIRSFPSIDIRSSGLRMDER